MTEAEWLACGDPEALLSAIEPRGRKVRLYALACCRRIWDRLDDATRALMRAAEQYRDGDSSGSDLLSESRLLQERGPPYPSAGWYAVRAVIDAACLRGLGTGGEDSLGHALEVSRNVARPLLPPTHVAIDYWERAEWRAESAGQAAIVRDIFPRQPVSFLPEWRTSTVLSLAEGMYATGDFSPMPILADALQDAGCDNSDILHHCRGNGPHVRGCWVVDLVLGRA
jgi:hypothetical protein